jgi:hypothetical protein
MTEAQMEILFVKQLGLFWLVVNQSPPRAAFTGKQAEK